MDKKFLNREGIEVVAVVTMRYGQEHNLITEMFCYSSPKVKSVEPCARVDGRYYRLKDGQEITINPKNMGTWPVSVGTVFSWADGEQVLLSRRIDNQKQFLLPKKAFTFNPQSMVRYDVK